MLPFPSIPRALLGLSTIPAPCLLLSCAILRGQHPAQRPAGFQPPATCVTASVNHYCWRGVIMSNHSECISLCAPRPTEGSASSYWWSQGHRVGRLGRCIGYSAVQATRLAMPASLAAMMLLTIKLQGPNRMTARQGEGSLLSHLTWRCLSGAASGDGGVSSGAPTLVAHSSCRFICDTPVAVYSALQPLQQQRARA